MVLLGEYVFLCLSSSLKWNSKEQVRFQRCFNDITSVGMPRQKIEMSIALTHLNEYECRLIRGEKYFSYGLTRNEIGMYGGIKNV